MTGSAGPWSSHDDDAEHFWTLQQDEEDEVDEGWDDDDDWDNDDDWDEEWEDEDEDDEEWEDEELDTDADVGGPRRRSDDDWN
jgi:hypothetical protein